jgi:hypothetical protein
MATPEKKESNIKTMRDVIFMYSSVNRAVEQLNTDKKPPISAPTSPTFNLEFHSFEIKILISEARFKKELKKEFKAAKNLPHVKEMEKDDLLEKYDFLKAEDLEDEMILVKFSQTALVGKANAEGVRKQSFPIKQIGIKGKVQDLNGLPIDQDTSLGNGTKGHFQFRPVDGPNGQYLYPQTVCITELIEYVGGGAEEDLDSLGLEDLDEADMDKEAEEQEEANNASNISKDAEADRVAEAEASPIGDDEGILF